MWKKNLNVYPRERTKKEIKSPRKNEAVWRYWLSRKWKGGSISKRSKYDQISYFILDNSQTQNG